MGQKFRAVLAGLALAVGSSGLSGCGYYGQAVRGHMDLVSRSRPIDEVIGDPATPPALADQLRLVLEARRFAFDELGLPDNGSYLQYAELDRRYVVWNVFAAPADSLAPRQWCFPVAGCVVYRGYFREDAARSYARSLEEEGLDVHVGAGRSGADRGRRRRRAGNGVGIRPDLRVGPLAGVGVPAPEARSACRAVPGPEPGAPVRGSSRARFPDGRSPARARPDAGRLHEQLPGGRGAVIVRPPHG